MRGILFTNIEGISKEKFIEALTIMVHRGPDVSLCYDNYDINKFAHNRLSIIDLDNEAINPFARLIKDMSLYIMEKYTITKS